MSDSIVRYELADGIATITMDDGKANALSIVMIEQLGAALERATSEANAVILTGRPDRFCAGFDLRVIMTGGAMELIRKGFDLLLRLYELPLPLVIASTGHTVAGGAMLLLTGDYRIATDGLYKFGLNEVAIGLPVAAIAVEFARARLLPSELTRATLLATIYRPTEARDAGFVDAVVEADELVATATREAQRFASYSKVAFAGTKQRIRQATIDLVRSTFEDDLRRSIQR